jgi:hypothetical protein
MIMIIIWFDRWVFYKLYKQKTHKDKCDPHEYVVYKTDIQSIRWDVYFPSCHFCGGSFLLRFVGGEVIVFQE